MNHLVSKEKDRQKIRRQFWRSFISSLIIFALVVLVLEWKRGFSHLSFSDVMYDLGIIIGAAALRAILSIFSDLFGK